jgi:hypothetical protein
MYIEFVCSEVRKTNFSTSGRNILHLVPRSELGMVSSRQTSKFAVTTKEYSPMMSFKMKWRIVLDLKLSIRKSARFG